MENKFDKNECVKDEYMCEDVDDLDMDEIEIDLDEFMDSSNELYPDVEYMIRNEFGDVYYLNYDFESDNGNYQIVYFEHHYTKFWGVNVQAKEYLNLKSKYIQKYHNDISTQLDLQDACRPTLILSVKCPEEDVKKALKLFEEIHNNFQKRFSILEKEVQKLISNFEL